MDQEPLSDHRFQLHLGYGPADINPGAKYLVLLNKDNSRHEMMGGLTMMEWLKDMAGCLLRSAIVARCTLIRL